MIEAAESPEHSLHGCRIGKVQDMALGSGWQRGERLVNTRLAARSNDHGGSLACGRLRGRQTNAGAATQQHDALPVQSHGSLSRAVMGQIGPVAALPPALLCPFSRDGGSSIAFGRRGGLGTKRQRLRFRKTITTKK